MKNILLFHPGINSQMLGAQSLVDSLTRPGDKFFTFFINEGQGFDKIDEILNGSHNLIITINLQGWKYLINKGEFGCFYSTLDTPYNKVAQLKMLDERCYVSVADRSHLPLCRQINPKVNFFFSPAFVEPTKELNNNVPLNDRSIDILFFGRLGFDKIDFRYKSRSERIMVKRIVKKAFQPNPLQIHEIAESVIAPLKKLGFSKTDFKSEEFFDYCWKLGHKVRSDRRVFVLKELSATRPSLKVCFVTDSVDYFDNVRRENKKILPFQPWSEIVKLMLDSKVVVNIQPYHIYGLHERLLAAMALGCVVITDRNQLLESRFEHQKDILFYDFKEDDLKNKLNLYLSKIELLQSIADEGKKSVLLNDLPVHRANVIAKSMGNCF